MSKYPDVCAPSDLTGMKLVLKVADLLREHGVHHTETAEFVAEALKGNITELMEVVSAWVCMPGDSMCCEEPLMNQEDLFEDVPDGSWLDASEMCCDEDAPCCDEEE